MLIYYSLLGGNLPGPRGNTRRIIEEFEKENIAGDEFADAYRATVADDSAVLTIGHYGFQLYLSPEIRAVAEFSHKHRALRGAGDRLKN